MPLTYGTDVTGRIKKLEDDLYMARSTILSLVSDRFSKLLQSYYLCRTREDSSRWLDQVIDQIVDSTEALAGEDSEYFGPRANCPLCGAGSFSPYAKGFTLGEGLRRHLSGWGNVHQCAVTEAAEQLARDYFHGQFAAAERAEYIAKQEERAKRKRTEILLRVGPGVESELMDDVHFSKGPRDDAEKKWAESRLSDIGFVESIEGNVKQYYFDAGNFGVFADPRTKEEISFRVYKKPFPKRPRKSSIGTFRTFSLRDSWKHDIIGKFQARLRVALGRKSAVPPASSGR